MKSFPKSKKQHKNFIIKISLLYIEKLGTDIFVSMHVTVNTNKGMLIHYFACRSTMVMTMAQKLYTGNMNENLSRWFTIKN